MFLKAQGGHRHTCGFVSHKTQPTCKAEGCPDNDAPWTWTYVPPTTEERIAEIEEFLEQVYDR